MNGNLYLLSVAPLLWNRPIALDAGIDDVACKQFGKSRVGVTPKGAQSHSFKLKDNGREVRFDGGVEFTDEVGPDGCRRVRLVAGLSLRRTRMNRRP